MRSHMGLSPNVNEQTAAFIGERALESQLTILQGAGPDHTEQFALPKDALNLEELRADAPTLQ